MKGDFTHTVLRRLIAILLGGFVFVVLPHPVAAQNMNARDYFILGQAKYRMNACEVAEEEFTRALNLDKTYVNAWLGRALCFLCQEEYEKAMADINQAIRLNNTDPIYLANRGRIKLAKGDVRGAESDYNVVLSMDSTCWEAWYGLGKIAESKNDFVTAQGHFEKSVTYKPSNPVALACRAEMKLKNQQAESAHADLMVALEMEPLYGEAWLLLGRSNHQLSEYGDALGNFIRSAELLPEDPRPWYERGNTWLKINREDSARANYSRAIRYNKKYSDAFFMRGTAEEKSGDVKAAVKDYTKCIKFAPKNIEAWRRRASIYRKEGNLKGACRDYTSAIKADPHQTDLLLERGFLLLEMGENQKAITDLNGFTKREPDNSRGWYGLGEAKYREGNTREACKDWKLAAEKGSEEAATALKTFCTD